MAMFLEPSLAVAGTSTMSNIANLMSSCMFKSWNPAVMVDNLVEKIDECALNWGC